MPEPIIKPTPPTGKHLIDSWTKGTPLEQAKEAIYSPKSTHVVFFGGLRIRCAMKQLTGGGLILEYAIVEGFTPNEVFVYDQVIIAEGAIMFPVDKPVVEK